MICNRKFHDRFSSRDPKEDPRGPDGLDMIRRLLQQAAQGKLKEQGIILLELDPEQVPPVQELGRQLFPESEISVEKDLAGLDRLFVLNRVAEAY